MEFATRMFVKAREWCKNLSKGQTMAEYALILAAVTVIVYITYRGMGNNLGSLVSSTNRNLTSAVGSGGD